MEREFYKKYFLVEKEHWLMVTRRQIVKDNLTRYLTGDTHEKTVLDFGCGSGVFVSELTHQGYNAFGLDISEEAIRFGAAQGIKNLGVINAHHIHFPSNTFDVVLSLDVLEHLEDEHWALAEISRVLKPNGVAIIMVPAFMFLWGVQDEVAHHYRRYTGSSLLEMIRRTELFKVLRSSYFNTFLFLPIAFVRIISRVFKVRGRESDFDINNSILNRFFFTIFDVERKLLKKVRFPFGVSILVVLEKK